MAQAARNVTAKDANEKLAHRRLTVLELAQRLGNVAEACRRGGIDRTSSTTESGGSTTTASGPPRLPQPRPPPVGDCRAVRQPVIRKTRRLRRQLREGQDGTAPCSLLGPDESAQYHLNLSVRPESS
jgi:hypothetical protein